MKLITITAPFAELLQLASARVPACILFLSASMGLGAQGHAQTLPDNIDISVSPNGIVPLPPTVSQVFTNVFERYTKIVAPNGQAIHFLIQNQVTDEMAVRAREVMRFFLTDVPGTQYGADKTAVANRMGILEAALVYFNTEQAAGQAFNGPLGNANIFAQDLYATESVVEGTFAYINNTNRDATFEEVFHLVHGAGIQPILPVYHAEMTAAKNAAKAAGNWTPPAGLPLQDEVFEYIISVIDVYYGYWAHDPDGDDTSFGGEYAFNTRASVEAGDPQGVAVMRKFLPEFFTAQLHCTAGFNATFTLTFNPGTEYTFKSRYMTEVHLSGSNPSNLVGNPLGNVLGGNSGNNAIDGGPGSDTASFSGPKAEYVIQCATPGFTVDDTVANRDGMDSLSSIEFLRFSDQVVAVADVCPQASATLRNGSGVNALCFSSTVPVLGSTWTAQVDTSGHPGATLTIILGYASPHPGLLLSIGELLVDGTSNRLLADFATPVGLLSTHTVSVPNNTSLAGFVAFTQGVTFGGGIQLCNAIDVVLGY